MTTASEMDFDALLKKASSLPTLPAVAMRVLELGEDPNAGLTEVADVVSNDAALSIRLLKAANSPLYASRRHIDNLRQAVSLLGFNTAITLTLSFSLEPPGDSGCLDKESYWRRSLIEAVAARVLAERLHTGNAGRFFLAALLQDIGMLVLEKAAPRAYAQIITSGGSHRECAEAERQAFGFDHAAIGSHLLRGWRIPDSLWQAVKVSHSLEDTGPSGEASDLDRCVYFSRLLADFWLEDESSRPAPPELAEWAAHHLDLTAEDVEALLSRIAHLLPEYETLFEVTLVHENEVAALLAEARDALILRSLKALQENSDYKKRTAALEVRNRMLEQQTYFDQLTGLYNGRRLNEVIENEFDAAAREGWPLSIGFIGVDHFKHVNDSYGNQAGDAVLESIVAGLMAAKRESDILARYGGEEFVLVLPGTGEEDARKVLERVRRQLAELQHDVGANAIAITVSIGSATFVEGADGGENIATCDDLLRAADRALYMAKREGRNRVAVYSRSAV